MTWLKELIRKFSSSKDRDSNAPQTGHPIIEQDSDSSLQLCCSDCGARYIIGSDSVLITMEMTKELLNNAVSITSSDSEPIVKKDLVSHSSSIPANRRPSVLAQSADALQSVVMSLKANQKRVWICHECKAQNVYPDQAPDIAPPTKTGMQSESETTIPTPSLDVSGTPHEQACDQVKPHRNTPSAHNGQDVLVGIAYLYASQLPGLYTLYGGLPQTVECMATEGPQEAKRMAPQGNALAAAVEETTQLAETHRRSELLAHVRETFAKADTEALMYMCMSWAQGARTMLLVGAQMDPAVMNDKETKEALLKYYSDTAEITLGFAGELGLNEQDVRRIDNASLSGILCL